MNPKFKLGNDVTFILGENKIRWCSIISIKISDNEVRYDLLKSGIKLYDIPEYYLDGTGTNLDFSELQ